MSYTSNRAFKFWSYSVSHSFLLLRSPNNEADEEKAFREGFNIDIEFVGVAYLDIPVLLRGITIEEIKENIPKKLSKYSSSTGYKVFEIKSDKQYYIVAGSYRIGKNNWFNEDRTLNPSLEYDEILATS